MRFLRNIIIAVGIMFSAVGRAQQVQVDQTIDSIAILIGQQARMTLAVTARHDAKIVWPRFKPSQFLVPGVEVVEQHDGEVTEVDGMTKVSHVYTLTSFDEKLYAIPALTVKVDGRTFKGSQLALKVLTVPVDTLHPNQFFPPKDVQDNPFLWSEWRMVFWLSIVVVMLCLLTGYLYVRLKKNKPIIARIKIVRHVPAHQKALHEIEEIKASHMANSENQKEYYTRLTDTLRKYIEERFGFNAMEMTSNEIICRLRETGDQKGIDELHELFETADLVKFAKHNALINENDLNLVNAAKFIDETKTATKEVEERIVPKLSEDEEKTRKNRVTLKTLIYTSVVLVIVLVAYIVYQLSQLLG